MEKGQGWGRVQIRKPRTFFYYAVNKTNFYWNFNWYLVTMVLEPNKSPRYVLHTAKRLKVLFLVLNFSSKDRVRSDHGSVCSFFFARVGWGFGSEELRVLGQKSVTRSISASCGP